MNISSNTCPHGLELYLHAILTRIAHLGIEVREVEFAGEVEAGGCAYDTRFFRFGDGGKQAEREEDV